MMVDCAPDQTPYSGLLHAAQPRSIPAVAAFATFVPRHTTGPECPEHRRGYGSPRAFLAVWANSRLYMVTEPLMSWVVPPPEWATVYWYTIPTFAPRQRIRPRSSGTPSPYWACKVASS